jgi:hypothetical protein
LLVEQQFYDLPEKTANKSWLDFKAFEATARKKSFYGLLSHQYVYHGFLLKRAQC